MFEHALIKYSKFDKYSDREIINNQITLQPVVVCISKKAESVTYN